MVESHIAGDGNLEEGSARWMANDMKMRKILVHIPIAVGACTLETDSRFTYLNDQFERTFGYTLADIPTVRAWTALAYPDKNYRAAGWAWWQTTLAGIPDQGHVAPKEFRIVCKDGAVRDVVISGAVLDDMVLLTFHDVTERRRMQEELVASHDQLMAIFDGIEDDES